MEQQSALQKQNQLEQIEQLSSIYYLSIYPAAGE